MPKIPLYNKTIREQSGYKAVSTPLLQSAPISSSGNMAKIVSQVLSKTNKALERYNNKLDRQEVINESYKLESDFMKDYQLLQQNNYDSKTFKKQYEKLKADYQNRVSSSDNSVDLGNKLNQIFLHNDVKANNNIFKMRNNEALANIDKNILAISSSDEQRDVKQLKIQDLLNKTEMNSIITPALKQKILNGTEASFDLADLQKDFDANPQYIKDTKLNDLQKEYPNLPSTTLERFQQKAKVKVREIETINRRKQNEEYNKKVLDLNKVNGEDKISLATEYINHIEGGLPIGINTAQENSLLTYAKAIVDHEANAKEKKVDANVNASSDLSLNSLWIEKMGDNKLSLDDRNELHNKLSTLYTNGKITRNNYINWHKKIELEIPKENRSIISSANKKLDKMLFDGEYSRDSYNKVQQYINSLISYGKPLDINKVNAFVDNLKDDLHFNNGVRTYFRQLFPNVGKYETKKPMSTDELKKDTKKYIDESIERIQKFKDEYGQ